MRRTHPNIGALRRALLTPIAEDLGVDYDLETIERGSGPGRRFNQAALGLVACGASLLLHTTYVPDGFPAEGRAGRRGAKAMVKHLGEEEARQATVFLTYALAHFVAETQRVAGHTESASAHLNALAIVEPHWPLNHRDAAALDDCLSYLADPEIPADSDNRWGPAGGRFRRAAIRHAILVTLPAADYARVAEAIIGPESIHWEALVLDLGDLRLWGDIAEQWTEAASWAIDAVVD